MDRFQKPRFQDPAVEYWPVLHEDLHIASSQIDNAALSTSPSFTSLATADETSEHLSVNSKRHARNAQFSNGLEFCQESVFDSAPMWRNTSTFPGSQSSSSTIIEEAVHPQTMIATTSGSLDLSSHLLSRRYTQDCQIFGGHIPHVNDIRVTIDPKPRQSTVISDLAATFGHHCSREVSETPSESLKLDIDNKGRDHPLYQNVAPHGDGLYHCPWEDQEGCQHQPAKLKCEYDTQVDSHLKPYRCKFAGCRNSRFSSPSCLYRHEREVHGMHGHGDKPHLCSHEGCERSVPGNGFPRYSNLQDHIKRIHSNLAPTENKALRYTSVPEEPTKGTKRKANSTDLDEAPRNKAAPPAEVGQKLVERYYQYERRLLEIVRQLHDPNSPSNMHLFWGATNCITLMAEITELIKERSTSGNFKQTKSTK